MKVTIPLSELSNTQQAYLSVAYDEAMKANDVLYRLACIAVKNGKIVSRGHNHSRTALKGRVLCSFHAEVDTLYRLLWGTDQNFRHQHRRSSQGKDR